MIGDPTGPLRREYLCAVPIRLGIVPVGQLRILSVLVIIHLVLLQVGTFSSIQRSKRQQHWTTFHRDLPLRVCVRAFRAQKDNRNTKNSIKTLKSQKCLEPSAGEVFNPVAHFSDWMSRWAGCLNIHFSSHSKVAISIESNGDCHSRAYFPGFERSYGRIHRRDST